MATIVVGEWAKDKLDRLGRYLHEYTKIMRKQAWCEGYYYIDAFAGPGQHTVRDKAGSASRNMLLDVASFGQSQEEQQRFLAGSPRVALDTEYPFTGYVFVERSPERVAELESMKAEYGAKRRILVRQRDCNAYLCEKVVCNPKIDWDTNRALVFLDPFSMQVPWSTRSHPRRGRNHLNTPNVTSESARNRTACARSSQPRIPLPIFATWFGGRETDGTVVATFNPSRHFQF